MITNREIECGLEVYDAGVDIVWFAVTYSIEGVFKPVTFESPAENPDLEVESYYAFATGEEQQPIPKHLQDIITAWCEQNILELQDKLETICWEDADKELEDCTLDAAIAHKEAIDDLRV